MSRKFFTCVAMVFLLQGSCGPVPENRDLEKAPEAGNYYVDVVAITLEKSHLQDPHFVWLRKGESEELPHWFHCGPMALQPSQFKRGNSYFGPDRADAMVLAKKATDGLVDPAKSGLWEYRGQLAYRVLTEGFPVKLQVTYTYRDLRQEKDIAKFEGVAQFARDNQMVMMRSETGNHLLLLRIRGQN